MGKNNLIYAAGERARARARAHVCMGLSCCKGRYETKIAGKYYLATVVI